MPPKGEAEVVGETKGMLGLVGRSGTLWEEEEAEVAAGRLSLRGVAAVALSPLSLAMVTGRATPLAFSSTAGDVVGLVRGCFVVVVVLYRRVVLLKPSLLEREVVLTLPPLPGSVEVVRCSTLGFVDVWAQSDCLGLKGEPGSVVFLWADFDVVVITGKKRLDGRVVGLILVGLFVMGLVVVGLVVVGVVKVQSMSSSWFSTDSAKEV